jgi:hypothetical protein
MLRVRSERIRRLQNNTSQYLSELSYRILRGSHSCSVGHVTQVDMSTTQTGYVRAKDLVPSINRPVRSTHNYDSEL